MTTEDVPPGWVHHLEEMSPGIYCLHAEDESDATIESTGVDPDHMKEALRAIAWWAGQER